MKVRVVLQDAIKRIRVEVSLQRRDITRLEFELAPEIFLNDCYIDGKPYEINLFSTLTDGRRRYKLPVFLSNLELHYDAALVRDAAGRLVLSDHSGWLPVWPDSDSLREFEIHFPMTDRLVTNYRRQNRPDQAGSQVCHLIGQGECLMVIGPFRRQVHYAHHYYLIGERDIELFDKFLRETKISLEQDLGPAPYPVETFIEIDQSLPLAGMLKVSPAELTRFSDMPAALARLIEISYPLEFGDYFRSFREPLYAYLAWRALRGVMSPSEQAKLFPAGRSGKGPLVEQTELAGDGLAFFKALADCLGQERFLATLRRVLSQHRQTPLSLVHFINHFGQDEPARQLLERWLFMGN